MAAPDFWDDAEKAQKINQELNDVKIDVDKYKALLGKVDDVETLLEMAFEEDDPSMEEDIKAELESLKETVHELERSVLLSGEYDGRDAILTLHAGAVLRLRTGRRCCCVCIPAGQSITDSR